VDAESVLARTAELEPVVLLLDMDSLGSLPESLLHRIRRAHPDLAILAMGTLDTEHAVARLLRAGVSGFVAKREPVKTLLRGVAAFAAESTGSPRVSFPGEPCSHAENPRVSHWPALLVPVQNASSRTSLNVRSAEAPPRFSPRTPDHHELPSPCVARLVLFLSQIRGHLMETILIIVVLVLLLGGGGFYWRGRR